MKDRTLIMVRHAHRDTTEGRERDNGLSERGREQSKALERFYRDRLAKQPVIFLSSPKVRCIETLLPLADRMKTEVQILDLLDEQHESDKAYARRVEKFLRWWKQRAPELVVACSHGDWIPSFAQLTLGIDLELKKGGCMELESTGRSVKLRWLLQKLP